MRSILLNLFIITQFQTFTFVVSEFDINCLNPVKACQNIVNGVVEMGNCVAKGDAKGVFNQGAKIFVEQNPVVKIVNAVTNDSVLNLANGAVDVALNQPLVAEAVNVAGRQSGLEQILKGGNEILHQNDQNVVNPIFETNWDSLLYLKKKVLGAKSFAIAFQILEKEWRNPHSEAGKTIDSFIRRFIPGMVKPFVGKMNWRSEVEKIVKSQFDNEQSYRDFVKNIWGMIERIETSYKPVWWLKLLLKVLPKKIGQYYDEGKEYNVGRILDDLRVAPIFRSAGKLFEKSGIAEKYNTNMMGFLADLKSGVLVNSIPKPLIHDLFSSITISGSHILARQESLKYKYVPKKAFLIIRDKLENYRTWAMQKFPSYITYEKAVLEAIIKVAREENEPTTGHQSQTKAGLFDSLASHLKETVLGLAPNVVVENTVNAVFSMSWKMGLQSMQIVSMEMQKITYFDVNFKEKVDKDESQEEDDSESEEIIYEARETVKPKKRTPSPNLSSNHKDDSPNLSCNNKDDNSEDDENDDENDEESDEESDENDEDDDEDENDDDDENYEYENKVKHRTR